MLTTLVDGGFRIMRINLKRFFNLFQNGMIIHQKDRSHLNLGHKSPMGAVLISNCKERTRLRWRYQGKRYSLIIAAYTKVNLGARRHKYLK